MSIDIYHGRASDRDYSPSAMGNESSREWWNETAVGGHVLTRERTYFVCEECDRHEAYPTDFEGEECDSS